MIKTSLSWCSQLHNNFIFIIFYHFLSFFVTLTVDKCQVIIFFCQDYYDDYYSMRQMHRLSKVDWVTVDSSSHFCERDNDDDRE